MVGRDDIDSSVIDRGPQRLLIGGRLDSRVAHDGGALGRVRRVVEKQMVDACFRGDPFVGEVSRLEQVELASRRDVQHVEARVVTHGQLDREAGRLVAGLFGPDTGVLAERNVVAESGAGGRFIGDDGRGVFAVRRNDQRRAGEDALEGAFVVDQHVAGARSHEHLDTTRQPLVDRFDRFEIVVGGAEVEAVVRHRPGGGSGVLVRERLGGDRLRIGVRHLHIAGDTAGHRCA